MPRRTTAESPFDYAKRIGAKLAAHASGEILWIDDISVPVRRAGHGSHLVELLEREAKRKGFRRIRLFAADEGHGPSDTFWDQMGYEYDCRDCEPDDLAARFMHKDLKGLRR